MQVTNILSLENEVLWKKHAICFADSGKAEVDYFYSCRTEHSATDVQLLGNPLALQNVWENT